MRPDEFQTEMNRLIDTYGKQHYSQPRMQLLWQEVRELSSDWLRKVIDYLLGSCRHAPLITDFREEIAKERNLRSEANKNKEIDAKDSWLYASKPSVITFQAKFIRRAILGCVPEKEMKEYLESNNRVGKKASEA